MLAPGPSDDELVLGIARGDEDAFRLLFRRHTPVLLGLTHRLLGSRAALAEDVVQESWLRAVRLLPGFAGRSSLRTWLCGIAVNCSREALRRESRRAASADDLWPGAATGTLPDLDLARAVQALPEGYREVLLLHDLVGLTHEEIASQLGIQAGTSKSQLSRARGALRALWREGVRPDGKERP
jgi:RNA polymerase sigma-70 factor (ECF subfamily)